MVRRRIGSEYTRIAENVSVRTSCMTRRVDWKSRKWREGEKEGVSERGNLGQERGRLGGGLCHLEWGKWVKRCGVVEKIVVVVVVV